MERALNGVDVPVYSYGKLVGLRKSYNDRLLMFMLRNRAPERFAEGKPKGMNAMDHTRLEREKKKWRKEWELERDAERRKVSPQDVRASLERKVEEVRKRVEVKKQREWEALSEETRAAWERFEALKARDLARSCPELVEGSAPSEPQPANPEPVEGERADEPETGPKVRRLKDEGWE